MKFYQLLPKIAGYFSASADVPDVLSSSSGIHSLAASLIPSRIGIQAVGIRCTEYDILICADEFRK